jgi:hypothetical protein
VTPLAFSGVGQLNGGCACQSTGIRDFGSDVDNEVAAGNERETVFLHYEHELSDNVSIYAQTLLGQNEVTDRRENISFILTWAPRLFADNAYLPSNIATQIAATGLTADQPASYPRYVNFALFGVNDGLSGLPDVRQITKNDLMSNTIGFDAQLDREGWLDGWRVDAYYQHGNNEQNFDTDNGIRVDRIPLAFDAVMGPNGPACYAALVNPAVFGDCVPMNIFGGVQNISAAARDVVPAGDWSIGEKRTATAIRRTAAAASGTSRVALNQGDRCARRDAISITAGSTATFLSWGASFAHAASTFHVDPSLATFQRRFTDSSMARLASLVVAQRSISARSAAPDSPET